MDPIEEQQQEIEILESIYPDEFTKLSNTRFTINLLLDVDSERKHAILLEVKYPPEYPEVVPDLGIDFGETEPPSLLADDDSDLEYDYDDDSDDDNNNGSDEDDDHHRFLNLVESIELEREDLHELLRIIRAEAEENIGMPT
ncbi:unnamed protein product [Ambrosiozyma monospora]|uniref:Unnamed protein product n=1 Tax=Ambrosiozyma monospora TaxID=43982 RepID=A0ACB5T332_AMBMO|nr:unnamed protein product [Ambrosiozyma monospora]